MAKQVLMVEVTHKCGRCLGTFGATDDNGSIEMHCPKCKKIVEIFNNPLGELVSDFDLADPFEEEHEYDHTKPIKLNDCFHKVVDINEPKRVAKVSKFAVYRIVTDEPLGIAIGFKPKLKGSSIEGAELELYTLKHDSGGKFYILDLMTIQVVSKWTSACEPKDDHVFRSQAEFDEALGEEE